MKSNRRITRVLTSVLVGAALLMVTAPIISTAEAHKRFKRIQVVKRHHPPRDHHRWRPVLRHLPRPVYVRQVRPWYSDTRRIIIDDAPFHFHAGLNIFFGGLGLHIDLGNTAPAGYVYYDPYCSLEFETVGSYHRHLSRHRHRGALRVVRIREYCGY